MSEKTCSECRVNEDTAGYDPGDYEIILCPKHAAVDELARALDELLDAQILCDEPLHPAWCSAHNTKRCQMRTLQGNARQALARYKETQP